MTNVSPESEFPPDIRRQKIFLVARILGLGFVIAVVFHALARVIFHAKYPKNTFLYDPTDRFMDFYNVFPLAKQFGLNLMIFPSLNLLYSFLNLFSMNVAFIVLIGTFVLYFTLVTYQHIYIKTCDLKTNLFLLLIYVLCGYPFLFAIDRGNIETWMFISVSLFAFLFQKKRFFLASLPLAFAIGMKLFPAVFLILYLKEKKYKELLFLFVLLGAMTGGLALLQDIPLVASRAADFFELYRRDYTIGDLGLAYGHSIFGLFKTLLYQLARAVPGAQPHRWLEDNSVIILRSYTAFTFIIYASAAAFIYFQKKMEYWRAVAILTILFCLLPNVSADYKLLHLYTPLLLFLNAETVTPDWQRFSKLFAFALIPKAYFFLNTGGGCSTLFEPILLTILLYDLIFEPVMAPKRTFFGNNAKSLQ